MTLFLDFGKANIFGSSSFELLYGSKRTGEFNKLHEGATILGGMKGMV